MFLPEDRPLVEVDDSEPGFFCTERSVTTNANVQGKWSLTRFPGHLI